MIFSVFTNIATMILCVAVLIQTVRLMRALDTVKGGALTDVVGALDASTTEARRVLGRLTELLRGDVAVTARILGEGKSMIEELTVITGIGNAIAERIIDAAAANGRASADVAPKRAARKRPEKPPVPAIAVEDATAAPPPRRRNAGPTTPDAVVV